MPMSTGVISFVVDGVHSLDVAMLLDQQGVAIRVGHHCAQPLVHRFGHSSVARISFGLYTDPSEVDKFAQSLATALELCR